MSGDVLEPSRIEILDAVLLVWQPKDIHAYLKALETGELI
jgi:hypothetical protein